MIHPGPAKVIRKPAWLDSINQCLELVEIAKIEFVGAAQGKRDAVHHHRIISTDGIQKVQWLATIDHVVLAENFEPVDVLRLAFENVLVVLCA